MAMNSTSAPNSISKDEVDVPKQLNNALEELGSVKLKCRTLKEENKDLRRKFELQLEASRRDNERLQQQLQQREQVIERLQAEIISIRKLNKATQQLDEMISSQRPSSDKTGIGYQKHHEKKDKVPRFIPQSNQSIPGPPPPLHQPVE
jgi:chromosome segregation ATPase